MLNIFYGDMKEAVYNTAAYFKYDYEDNWITDPFVKKMIKDVDQSIVLDIAETEDRTINLRHLMKFEVEPFDIRILNTNEIVHTMEELVSIAGEFV